MKINISFLFDKQGRSKVPLAKSRLFWAGLLLKLALSICFASTFLRDLFAPFANYFIESGFQDPYNYFIQNGKGIEFPYPPLMLWLFSVPRMLVWPLFPGSMDAFSAVDSLVYRIPLLLADITILLVLMRWLKNYTRQVLVWYWLSPVLIYINYFHGQLDVIPMALMIASLYFLFKSNWVLAFVLIGLAIGCKTNMVLVLPFYVLYLIRISKVDFKTLFLSLLSFTAVLLLINLPYIHSDGMIQMVYNKTLRIYFIPAIYFILVLYYCTFKFVNRDQLILFLAFTFLALTLMIAPMQGWYYWILPLLVYFVIKQSKIEKYTLIILSVLYFVYFGLIQESDYFFSFNFIQNGYEPLDPKYFEKAQNVCFTLLQTTLALLAYLVFKNGIRNNIQTKFLSQPYLIGIGGDSASGKSTLSNALAEVFELSNTSIIRGDDMHKWERGDENWTVFTHLDPRANKIHEDFEHAKELKSGKSIQRRNYDHSTGKFTLPKFIKPNKLIVFEGLHSFYLNNQSSVYDLKIFMEPDERLRMWWKVQRDVAKRGYSPEKVLEQLKMRDEDSQKYIRSQANQADIIAQFYPLNDIDPINQNIEPIIGLKMVISNGINLDLLIERLNLIDSLTLEHKYNNEHQELYFKGVISNEHIEHLADRCIPELEDVGIYNTKWKENYEGILQLISTFIIFNSMKNKYLNARQ